VTYGGGNRGPFTKWATARNRGGILHLQTSNQARGGRRGRGGGEKRVESRESKGGDYRPSDAASKRGRRGREGKDRPSEKGKDADPELDSVASTLLEETVKR